MKDVLFYLVLFYSNVIQSITGFAGTVLAMPPSILLLGFMQAEVVLNAMALLSGLIIAVMSWRDLNYKEFITIIAGMLLGMIPGLLLLHFDIPENILMLVYGIAILLIAVRGFVRELAGGKQQHLPRSILYLILILAGVMHGMFVSGGALLVVYGTHKLPDKKQFRATVAPVWTVLNSIILITQLKEHAWTSDTFRYLLVGTPILLAATYIGALIAKRISRRTFLRITYLLLMISGLSMII